MLTAAAESECGRWLHQVGGPALGIYQMEPATHDDIWANWLRYKPGLAADVKRYGGQAGQLPGNLYYATAMARIHYLRRPEALPSAMDEWGLAEYYKKYYNTHLGKSTVEGAIEKYRRFAIA